LYVHFLNEDTLYTPISVTSRDSGLLGLCSDLGAHPQQGGSWGPELLSAALTHLASLYSSYTSSARAMSRQVFLFLFEWSHSERLSIFLLTILSYLLVSPSLSDMN
jgi:hypothetical protein